MASKNNNEHIESEENQLPPLTAQTSKKEVVSSASFGNISAKPKSEQEIKKENQESTMNSSKVTDKPKVEVKDKDGKEKSRKNGLIAVALLLLVGGIGHVYYQQQNRELQQQLTALQSQLKETQSSFLKIEKTMEDKAEQVIADTGLTLSQQQRSIDQLQIALNDIKGRRPNDWLLAESDYLIKLAGRKLFLERDVATAIALVEEADLRIAALNDPSLAPLRKAMAQDVSQLKKLPLIDRDGLVLRLSSLEQQVAQLPLANTMLQDEPETATTPDVTNDLYDWKDNLMASLKSFSAQFITFRVRDGSATPLLSPQQHFYLRENISEKLETAIKAVYREQSDVYKMALETTDKWSSSFFDQNDRAVIAFRKTLVQLKEQNIKVNYPKNLQTQTILSDVIRERLRRNVKSMTGTTKAASTPAPVLATQPKKMEVVK